MKRLIAVAVLCCHPALAEQALCELSLLRVVSEREQCELEIELARAELAATTEIHALIDALWQKDAIQRVLWLTARHARDVAQVELKRQELLLERYEAEHDYLASLCAGGKKPRAESRARWEQAECHRLGKELAIAALDLAFHTALLDSANDLRQGDVATRQDVILAELAVARASERVESYRPRVEACVSSGKAAGGAAR